MGERSRQRRGLCKCPAVGESSVGSGNRRLVGLGRDLMGVEGEVSCWAGGSLSDTGTKSEATGSLGRAASRGMSESHLHLKKKKKLLGAFLWKASKRPVRGHCCCSACTRGGRRGNDLIQVELSGCIVWSSGVPWLLTGSTPSCNFCSWSWGRGGNLRPSRLTISPAYFSLHCVITLFTTCQTSGTGGMDF